MRGNGVELRILLWMLALVAGAGASLVTGTGLWLLAFLFAGTLVAWPALALATAALGGLVAVDLGVGALGPVSTVGSAAFVAPFLLILGLIVSGSRVPWASVPRLVYVASAFCGLTATRLLMEGNVRDAALMCSMACALVGTYILGVARPRDLRRGLTVSAWTFLIVSSLVNIAPSGYARYEGVSGNANGVALGLAVLLPWASVAFEGRGGKLLALILYCAVATPLVASSGSATALVAFPVALLLSLFVLHREQVTTLGRISLVLTALLALSLATATLNGAIGGKFNQEVTGDWSGRTEIFQSAWAAILQFPILGQGRFLFTDSIFFEKSPHNTVLTALLLGGAVAGALLVWIVALTISACWRAGPNLLLVPVAVLAPIALTTDLLPIGALWVALGAVCATAVPSKRATDSDPFPSVSSPTVKADSNSDQGDARRPSRPFGAERNVARSNGAGAYTSSTRQGLGLRNAIEADDGDMASSGTGSPAFGEGGG